MNNGKTTRSGKRTALIILCAVLALILALLVLGTIYMESMMGLINRNPNGETISREEYQEFLDSQTETADPDFTGEVLDPEDVTWETIEGVIEQGNDVINILLIGQDRRPGEGRSRSDAMILCTFNKSEKTITMTSFMRDMWVQIPGYYDERINVCYMLGGMPLLNECLEKNFGVQVDGNFEVDFSGFIRVIDVVGGVDVTLTEAEANHLNNQGFALTAGMNHLNGEEALAYSRIRAIGDDFGRTARQRTVLSALMQKAKQMSLGKLNSALRELLPMLTTDLSNAEILGYALELFPILSDLNVETLRIPADGTYRDAEIQGNQVLIPDLVANRELLAGCMKD